MVKSQFQDYYPVIIGKAGILWRGSFQMKWPNNSQTGQEFIQQYYIFTSQYLPKVLFKHVRCMWRFRKIGLSDEIRISGRVCGPRRLYGARTPKPNQLCSGVSFNLHRCECITLQIKHDGFYSPFSSFCSPPNYRLVLFNKGTAVWYLQPSRISPLWRSWTAALGLFSCKSGGTNSSSPATTDVVEEYLRCV